MEELQRQQEIINLGKKLVEEFTVNERISLTLRWMAHYLAELITKAEDEVDPFEKQEKMKKAGELILSIWAHRYNVPRQVRPLGNLSLAVGVLATLKASDPNTPYWKKMREIDQQDIWSTFASKLRFTSEHMYGILVLSNANLDLLKKEEEWLAFPNLLSSDEKEFIENFKDFISDNDSFAGIYFSKTTRTSSSISLEKAFDKMQRLMDEQQKALNILRHKIIGNKPVAEKSREEDLEDLLDDLDL
jgi:hypothetical protein